jgi:hypothetical protein
VILASTFPDSGGAEITGEGFDSGAVVVFEHADNANATAIATLVIPIRCFIKLILRQAGWHFVCQNLLNTDPEDLCAGQRRAQ